jgi:nucleotide-binding universal stress UspA family protein
MQNKRILIAIDDSDASAHAVRYVADIIGPQQDYWICLWHMPGPIPPRLLEHGGSEDPTEERQLDAALDNAQAAWVEKADLASEEVFRRARVVLQQIRLPAQAIATQTATPVPGQDLDTCILEAARQHECRTIVVGRASFSWWQELFQHHVADRLVMQSQGFTLWVVQ